MVPEVLAAFEARPGGARLVVLSDFDGTLAAFDVDPSAPTLRGAAKRALDGLAARGDVTVGLVSGRRVDDLDRRTSLPPHVYLAGLHGLEIRRGARLWHHPDLVESREAADEIAARLLDAVGHVAGVRLEHKGVAVTVHVRGVPTARDEVLSLAADAARPWLEAGVFKLLRADQALEVLPNIEWTKGDAVRWILEDVESWAGRPAWCVFFGDDVTDEDAFRAVSHGLSVVVGRRPSAALFRLDSPADVAAVLSRVNGGPPERRAQP